MTEQNSVEERYGRIEARINDHYGQVELLAAKHLDMASAFCQAMAVAADELGEEYAADFRQRLATDQGEGGWPNPSLLAEIKERNPVGMENFLDRFEAICEQQRQAYNAELDELIADMRAEKPSQESRPEERTPSKFSRIRNLARATLRGGETIHF